MQRHQERWGRKNIKDTIKVKVTADEDRVVRHEAVGEDKRWREGTVGR